MIASTAGTPVTSEPHERRGRRSCTIAWTPDGVLPLNHRFALFGSRCRTVQVHDVDRAAN